MFDEEKTEINEYSGEQPAAPSSGLAGLRAQREQIKKALHLDLQVPRYTDPVFVRYSAPSKSLIRHINDRAEKSRDKNVLAEAMLLAECCVGVFQKDSNGDPIGDPEEWPKFDAALAEYLGEPNLTRATDVVRALYLTDGDVLGHSADLSRWAGFAGAEAAEEYEGN